MGFTLVELLMATMVTGVILSAVAMLSQSLANYNQEGEAAIELSTNARFALSSSRYAVQRDVRAAQAMGVSSSGGLVLWQGDLDNDNRMALREFVVVYHEPRDRTLRRVTYTGGPVFANIGSSQMSQVLGALDAGTLTVSCPPAYGKQETVISRHVDLALFRPNRPYPETGSVEYLLKLSRLENRIESSGRPTQVSFYGSATMQIGRASWRERV